VFEVWRFRFGSWLAKGALRDLERCNNVGKALEIALLMHAEEQKVLAEREALVLKDKPSALGKQLVKRGERDLRGYG